MVLDALLSAYGVVVAIPRQGLQPTLALLKQLVLQVIAAYSAAAGKAEGAAGEGGGDVLAPLALVLQKHAISAEWAAGLLQPTPDQTLAVLDAMGASEEVSCYTNNCVLQEQPSAFGAESAEAVLVLKRISNNRSCLLCRWRSQLL